MSLENRSRAEGKPVYLSGREFQLLRYFMERPGITISRAELLRAVWGYEAGVFTRTVDVHVFSLRQKLEDEPSRRNSSLRSQELGTSLLDRETCDFNLWGC